MISAKVITLFVVSSLIGSAFGIGCPTPPKAASGFDITKVKGRWFEIKRTSGFTEDGLRCVTADFIPRSDGNFNTTNSALRKNGQRATEFGSATRVSDVPNELQEISSVIPVAIPFYIVETDNENYMSAYTCIGLGKIFHYETAWIFSRKNTLDAAIVSKLEKQLVSQFGIYETTIEITDQKNCTYYPSP